MFVSVVCNEILIRHEKSGFENELKKRKRRKKLYQYVRVIFFRSIGKKPVKLINENKSKKKKM